MTPSSSERVCQEKEPVEPLNAQGRPLFEERIVLLGAIDEANAWQRALQLGPSLDEQYINAEGNQLVWAFERILEVKVILEDQLGDGVEVFHRFLREDESKASLNRSPCVNIALKMPNLRIVRRAQVYDQQRHSHAIYGSGSD